MTLLKGLLLAAGCWGAGLALSFVWFMVGATVAGKSHGPRVTLGMVGAMLATAVTFLVSTGVLYRGLGRLHAPQGPRVAGTLLYGLLACASSALIAFMMLLGFNR